MSARHTNPFPRPQFDILGEDPHDLDIRPYELEAYRCYRKDGSYIVLLGTGMFTLNISELARDILSFYFDRIGRWDPS